MANQSETGFARTRLNVDIQLLIAKVVGRVRQVGLRSACREGLRASRALQEKSDYDLRHVGVDTGGREPLWKFDIRSKNAPYGTRYEATDEQELVDAVDFLHEDPANWTFIDLGCGKGRTLLVASQLGFKRVIGVEFARELVEIAGKNLTKSQIINATVLHADAADFEFPSGDIVVYLYNPFSGEVMTRVVESLREAQSRRLYVIYKAPMHAEIIDSSGFLTRLGSPPTRPYIQVWKHHTAIEGSEV